MMTITKIAINNLKFNKSRSIVTIFTIILTSCLLLILGSSGVGLIKYNMANVKALYGDYHASYHQVKEDQLSILQHHAQVLQVGYSAILGTLQSEVTNSSLAYLEENAAKLLNLRLIEGKLPQKVDELVAQREFLTLLGADAKLGSKIRLSYRVNNEGVIRTKEFTVSGILASSEANILSKRYQVYVSEQFYKQEQESWSYSVYLKVAGEENFSYEGFKDKLIDIAADIGIDEKGVDINENYLMWVTNPGTEIKLVCIGIGILIVLFSILVIYNIFYVGLIYRVQEFGKLRALGSTKRQLRGIIFREGMILYSIAMPIGIILGLLLTEIGFHFMIFRVMEQSVDIVRIPLFQPTITIFVIVITFLTVYFSMLKPMRIASIVSPTEAIRYEGEVKRKNKTRKGYQEIGLLQITISNLARHKKRTIVTLLTMSLSCSLFVVVANVLGSFRPEDYARESLEKGDFSLYLDYYINDVTYPENNLNNLQKENLMGEELIKEIMGIDGVTRVETRSSVMAKLIKDGLAEDESFFSIDAMTEKEYEARTEECEQGVLDYQTAVTNNGIIFTYGNLKDYFGLSIGDTLNLELYVGDELIPLQATLQAFTTTTDTLFILPDKLLEKLATNVDMTTRIFIYCNKTKEVAVEEALRMIAARDTHYSLTTFEEELDMAEFTIGFLRIPTYALLCVIGVIGFMNLLNTLITSIITRKKELGILQAIGLSNRQLIRMLQMEGLFFTLCTLLISLIVGNGLGYLTFLWAKNTSFLNMRFYHFPRTEMIVMAAVLIGLQVFFSFSMTKHIHRETMIERIRYQE